MRVAQYKMSIVTAFENVQRFSQKLREKNHLLMEHMKGSRNQETTVRSKINSNER